MQRNTDNLTVERKVRKSRDGDTFVMAGTIFISFGKELESPRLAVMAFLGDLFSFGCFIEAALFDKVQRKKYT